jgi:hypothetical protein
MAKLNAKKAELKAVVEDLGALQSNLAAAKDNKAKLEFDVDLCEKKLVRTKQPIDGPIGMAPCNQALVTGGLDANVFHPKRSWQDFE